MNIVGNCPFCKNSSKMTLLEEFSDSFEPNEDTLIIGTTKIMRCDHCGYIMQFLDTDKEKEDGK